MLANDTHYVVTNGSEKNERIILGWTLPLTERAARQFARKHNGRVIKRTTARRTGLI